MRIKVGHWDNWSPSNLEAERTGQRQRHTTPFHSFHAVPPVTLRTKNTFPALAPAQRLLSPEALLDHPSPRRPGRISYSLLCESVMEALALQENLNIFSQNCRKFSSNVKLLAALNKSMGKRLFWEWVGVFPAWNKEEEKGGSRKDETHLGKEGQN